MFATLRYIHIDDKSCNLFVILVTGLTENQCYLFYITDHGYKSGDHPQGWREVPPHDPQVQDAAHHAVQTIQQRSNSLFPYELLEIIHAKAEVSALWSLSFSGLLASLLKFSHDCGVMFVLTFRVTETYHFYFRF